MNLLEIVLMLSGALLWTAIVCTAAAIAIHKLIKLGEKD